MRTADSSGDGIGSPCKRRGYVFLGVVIGIVVWTAGSLAFAQSTADQGPPRSSMDTPVLVAGSPATPAEDYRVGLDDVLSVTVLQAPELNKTARVSQRGEISIPLVGTVPVAGFTLQQVEEAIEQRLREKYIREPDVTVQATDVQSQAVSVVGAVRKPGIVQIRRETTLLEVLSLAGGLADDAGDSVVLLRYGMGHSAPQAGTSMQPVQVPLKSLMESRDPQFNLLVQPGDVVNVQSAAIVYVVGAVKKPGAFAVRGNDRLTILRALALGEGLAPTAAGDAVVVRANAGGERVEIAVDLDGVLKGKSPDIALNAQDVLFVPTSGSKAAARATLDALTRILSFRTPIF